MILSRPAQARGSPGHVATRGAERSGALEWALSDGAARVVGAALVASAGVELLILRLGLRSAVHIPGLTPIEGRRRRRRRWGDSRFRWRRCSC